MSSIDLYNQEKSKILTTSTINRERLILAIRTFKGGKSYKGNYSKPDYNEILNVLKQLQVLQLKYSVNDTQISKFVNKLLKSTNKQVTQIVPNSISKTNFSDKTNFTDETLNGECINKSELTVYQDPAKINLVKLRLQEKQQQKQLVKENQMENQIEYAAKENDPAQPKPKLFNLWEKSSLDNLLQDVKKIGLQKAEDVQARSFTSITSSVDSENENNLEKVDIVSQTESEHSNDSSNSPRFDVLSRSSSETSSSNTSNYSLENVLRKLFPNDLTFQKYSTMFEEQEIDYNAFILLTSQDLDALGITLIGPRIKIQKEIARLQHN